VKVHRSHAIDPGMKPEPSYVSTLSWTRGKRAHRHPTIRLRLANVRSLQLLVNAAGFRRGQVGTLQVRTTGAVTIHLAGRTIHVKKGRHVVRFTA